MTSVARRTEDSGEFSEGSQEIEHSNSGNEGDPVDSDYETPGDVSDTENPENQEPGTERRVDDDEDRSNPQYIPKRGTFYEHDDRTADNGEETTNTTSEQSTEKEGSETGTERRRPPRKSDVINKWSHDKYNENEQMPKSRDELVSIYGYDIRNEDAPPHARRNRRYGRGPNKYTRTWEDEEAYKRQTAAQAQPRKPPTAEDFPELDAAKRQPRKQRTPRSRSQSQPESNDSSISTSASGTPIRRYASMRSPKHRPSPAIKSGVRATVRTPPMRPARRESGDVRNREEGRNRENDLRKHGSENARNKENDVRRDNDRKSDGKGEREIRIVRDDVRRGDNVREERNRESGDVRNRDGDVRIVREDRNRESGDVRNRGDNERVVRESGDVRRDQRETRELKMPAIEKLTIAVSNSEGAPQRKVLAMVAQQRPVPTEHAKGKTIPQGPPLNSAIKPTQQKPQPAQPAGSESRGGSKRYSSLRQRPLAEPTYTPQQQPQQLQPLQQQIQQPLQQSLQQPLQQSLQQPLQQSLQQSLQQPLQQPQHRYAGPPGGGDFSASNNAGHNPAQLTQQHIMHQQVVRNTSAPPHAASPPHQLPPAQPPHPQQTAKYEDAKYEVRLGLLEQQQLVQHQMQQAQAQQAQQMQQAQAQQVQQSQVPPVQQVPHPNPPQHPMHSMPQPHAIGQMPPQLQPTQGYAPPAMMPAQYMQSGSQAVYGPAPMYASPPAPYTHPQIPYPHHNYATQAGGVTYFNCAEQEVPPPQRTSRRPTAAIPIVKPNQPERPGNSIEKDNIDRIVENMFVRKPWPATHGNDSKEKSQSERSSQEPTPKDLSQPNSLTSSSISTDSKPSLSESTDKEEPKEPVITEKKDTIEKVTEQLPEVEKTEEITEAAAQESIAVEP